MATSGVRYFRVDVVESNGRRTNFGRFASFSGGEKSVTVAAAWNGGDDVPDRTQSRPVYGNIVVGRPFRPNRDRALIRQLQRAIGLDRLFTVTKTDLDANGNKVNDSDSWTGCICVRVSEPTYAEDDSSPAMWEIEFAPQSHS